MKSNLFNSRNNYRPKKVITGYATSSEGISSWLYDDLENDPWWQGSGAVPYRFRMLCTVTPTHHGSHLTREPFGYNGLDITSGMWVCALSESKALLITKVISKTPYLLEIECEDQYRYNTFKDNSGNGNASFLVPAPVIFFELGDDGLPVFDPLPPEATDIGIIGQIESRFRFFNKNKKQRLYKQSHDFMEGDFITIRNGEYERQTDNDISFGVVTDIGPSPNEFWVHTDDFYEIEPGFSGDIGTIGWYSNGSITTTQQDFAPQLMKIKKEVICYTYYENDNVTCNFDLNGVKLYSNGSLMAAINTQTQLHGCVAESTFKPITVTTSELSANTQTNILKFKINGVNITVITPSIQYGSSGMIGAWDVVKYVNERTYEHGCTAYVNNDGLFYMVMTTNTTFENLTPNVTSGMEKTFTDMFLFDTQYTLSEPTYKISRIDGGDIVITSDEVQMEPQSSSNGSLAVVYKLPSVGRTSVNYVVNNIEERNALATKTGDQVYVLDSGHKEWALFIKTGSSYVKVSDENSANTDANTFEILLTSNDRINIGNMSKGSLISNITCIVTVAFSDDLVFGVGSNSGSSNITDGAFFDFTTPGTYTFDSQYTASVDDEPIWVTTISSSTVGMCKLIISYV